MIDLSDTLILIKGGGDLASGVALRLYRSGFPIVMTELPRPLMVRRTVSFGEAVNLEHMQVEGVTAVYVPDAATARILATGRDEERPIPVLIDSDAGCRDLLKPTVVVDAIMAKRNLGTTILDAPYVVALGPGFQAGIDCHVVIETNRGHSLGRAIHCGPAEPDTGVPGEIGGKSTERLLRAPVAGVMEDCAEISQRVTRGDVVARVAGCEVRAQIDGVLRGLLRSGVQVQAGLKIGDVDPRAEPADCFLVSDKALAIGGGVLEAILAFLTQDRGTIKAQTSVNCPTESDSYEKSI
jgi:xanthine dehydrogenase accessory factor